MSLITHQHPGAYKSEKKSALLINILYLMSLLIGALSISMMSLSDTHALTPEYQIRLCESTHYGVSYTPLRERTCGLIWQKLSYDMLPTE